MSLQRAERILTQSTRADEVNLEGVGIDSLAPLLPLFSQMTRLRRLKLARNQLTSLPEDLSVLRNLESLDLSGNPVSGLNGVLRGLLCMPQLKHLSVDLPFESEEDEIIVTLQSLESFNGTSLTDSGDAEDAPAAPVVQQQQQQHSATPRGGSHSGGTPRQAWGAPSNNNGPSMAAKTRWDDADTSQANRLFQVVAQISGNRLSQAQQSQFDELTRNVVGHLNSMQHSTEEDPHKKETDIMKSKKILFEYCFEEATRGASRVDSNIGQALSVLGEHYTSLLNGYDRLVRSVMESKDRKLDALKVDMQNAIQEIESLMHQVEANRNGGGGDDSGSAQRFEAERRRWNEEMGWLKTENERLQTRLRQADLARQGGAPQQQQQRAGASSSARETSYNGQPSPARSTPPPTIGSKVLTLRQLRDTIEEIYASKSKYDIKCSETHLPRETMEQHMYTYLNQRYGLKHIILEWATAIVQGIKRFSSEDNDVAVFGKILRNEIDEEFRFVQRQLKETVFELLRVYVKGKRPLKVDEEINSIVKKKTNGRITEEEWVDIVKYMYNNEDAVTIIMRIRDVLKQQARPRRAASAAAAATTRASLRSAASKEDENAQLLLSYNEFIRILLDFQLEGHERFLGRFVRIFKQHDTDRNGILNEHEFRAVLRAVDPTKTDEEVTALLDLIDPHNNQLINFSECVTFLSSELVKMMRDEGN